MATPLSSYREQDSPVLEESLKFWNEGLRSRDFSRLTKTHITWILTDLTLSLMIANCSRDVSDKPATNVGFDELLEEEWYPAAWNALSDALSVDINDPHDPRCPKAPVADITTPNGVVLQSEDFFGDKTAECGAHFTPQLDTHPVEDWDMLQPWGGKEAFIASLPTAIGQDVHTFIHSLPFPPIPGFAPRALESLFPLHAARSPLRSPLDTATWSPYDDGWPFVPSYSAPPSSSS